MKTTKTKALAAALIMSMAVTGTVPEAMQATDPFAQWFSSRDGGTGIL